MGRVYTVEFHNISVNAVQDLLAVYAGASMPFLLHGFNISQITTTTVAMLNISVKRLYSTVTTGSGGASITPKKAIPGDAAATVTARRNDTTQATSSTTDILLSDVWNVLIPYQYFWPEKMRPVIGLSGAAVISLDSGPTATNMSGSFTVEEML